MSNAKDSQADTSVASNERNPSPLDLRLIPLPNNVTGIKIYKVLGGADATLRSYNEAVYPAKPDDLDGSNSNQLSDWKALYTQFLAEHTLGTIPYRWERDYEEAVLIEATIDSINVIIMDGPFLHDGSISGSTKAEKIKELLKMDPAVPLMEGLGRRDTAAIVRETPAEWELIVPHGLLTRLVFQECVVARFRRHSTLPITSRWTLGGNPASWQHWDEDSPPAGLPDLDTSWIDKALSK